MNQERAIIFDLDGTLADTAPDLLASLNYCVKGHGFPIFTLDEIGHLVGQGSIAMIKRAFALHETPLCAPSLQELHCEFLAHYEANISVHSKLYPGTLELLNRLTRDGYTLCVCTNKYESMARKLLTELAIIDRFASITGGDSFEFRKPDARHLTQTLAMANKTLGIMIGDTITDANAAQNAKMPLILVDFGYSSEPVEALHPDVIISHFNECFDAIKKLC